MTTFIAVVILVTLGLVCLLVAVGALAHPDEKGPMPKRYGGFGSSISGGAGS